MCAYASPIPRGLKKIKCYIKRERTGISKKIYPRYDLMLSTKRCLMIGQKNQIMRSAYYLITTDHSDLARKSPGYVGKLRSNLLGTEFSLFSEGENPRTKLPAEQIRNEHAAVVYKTSVFSQNSSPEMHVIIPEVVDENKYYVWKPLHVFLEKRL